jgi:hypothetical protein
MSTKVSEPMNDTIMNEIYIKACNLGLMDEGNCFKLRMSPSAIIELQKDSLSFWSGQYRYGAGSAKIIADPAVGTYKIEKL